MANSLYLCMYVCECVCRNTLSKCSSITLHVRKNLSVNLLSCMQPKFELLQSQHKVSFIILKVLAGSISDITSFTLQGFGVGL